MQYLRKSLKKKKSILIMKQTKKKEIHLKDNENHANPTNPCENYENQENSINSIREFKKSLKF